jgi:hypothetical protein
MNAKIMATIPSAATMLFVIFRLDEILGCILNFVLADRKANMRSNAQNLLRSNRLLQYVHHSCSMAFMNLHMAKKGCLEQQQYHRRR